MAFRHAKAFFPFLIKSVSVNLFALLILCDCASHSRSLRLKAKDDFVRENYAAAETKLLSPDVVGESKSRLLTLLELGTVAHYQGQYEKSNLYFFKAKSLADKLYTKSVSEAALTLLLNDNAETYSGMEYELSLVHYYTVMNFLLLSNLDVIPPWQLPPLLDGKTVVMEAEDHAERKLSAKEKVDFRQKARAETLAWDSYLQIVRHRNRGKPYYKDDLLNKLIAADVHRRIDGLSDRQIAKQLYDNAKQLLIRAYPSYASFNLKAPTYIDNYAKFEGLGEEVVLAQYIDPTPAMEAVKRQIDESTKLLANQKGNLLVVLEVGTVAEKREKTFTIGLSTLFSSIEDPNLRSSLEQIGLHVVLQIAPSIGVPMVIAAVGGAAGSSGDNEPKHITEAIDRVVGFEFKLPDIPYDPIQESFKLVFLNLDTKKETEHELSLAQPINDIATLNVEKRAASIALKTGTRVGLKYLAALIPAIVTYQKVDGPELLKVLVAGAVWTAAKKIIDATERADIRAWNMLPKWIGIADLQLPQGSYQVFAVDEKTGKRIDLRTVQTGPNLQKALLKRRLFSYTEQTPS